MHIITYRQKNKIVFECNCDTASLPVASDWPRYEEATDLNIRLDTDIHVESNYLKKNLDTLERVYKEIGKYN
jgi:hypothetical protein